MAGSRTLKEKRPGRGGERNATAPPRELKPSATFGIKPWHVRTAALLYVVAITVASLLPSGSGTPLAGWDAGVTPSTQNALHLPAYALLAFLVLSALHSSVANKVVLVPAVLVGCVAFGAMMEVLQAVAVPGRYGSLGDVLANAAGVAFGTAIWSLFALGYARIASPRRARTSQQHALEAE